MFEEKSVEIQKIGQSQKNFKDAIQALEKQLKDQNFSMAQIQKSNQDLILQKQILTQQNQLVNVNY